VTDANINIEEYMMEETKGENKSVSDQDYKRTQPSEEKAEEQFSIESQKSAEKTDE
jgi:hypothetical protein